MLLHFSGLFQSHEVARSFPLLLYAGLPPLLAKNANGGFSFGRILDTFKVSDISLNKIAEDTSNTSNRSPREEFYDCDMAINILVFLELSCTDF